MRERRKKNNDPKGSLCGYSITHMNAAHTSLRKEIIKLINNPQFFDIFGDSLIY